MIEKALTCVAFILLCRVFPPGYLESGHSLAVPPDDLLYQIMQSIVYFGCGMYLLLAIHARKSLPEVPIEIILLVFLALLSSIWSFKPSSTLIRGIGLLGATVVGVYVAYRYTLREILMILWTSSVLMLIASIIAIAVFPEYGIVRDEWSVGTSYEAAYRGVFHNKNTLAIVMLLAAITFLYCSSIFRQERSKLRYPNYVFLVLALAVLIVAHSVSVYLTTASVTLGTASLVLIARSRMMRLPFALLAIWMVSMVLVLFFSNPAMITTILGREPTLTNRTVIWAFAFQMIEARPLLGYGYGVFWDSVGSILGVVNAHNGYLTVVLDLGLIGAVLLLTLLARTTSRCWSVVMSSPMFIATWPAAVLLAILVNNLSEAELFGPNSVQWCLFVIVTAICARASKYRSVESRGSSATAPAKWAVPQA